LFAIWLLSFCASLASSSFTPRKIFTSVRQPFTL
jgi:hypothetical protein